MPMNRKRPSSLDAAIDEAARLLTSGAPHPTLRHAVRSRLSNPHKSDVTVRWYVVVGLATAIAITVVVFLPHFESVDEVPFVEPVATTPPPSQSERVSTHTNAVPLQQAVGRQPQSTPRGTFAVDDNPPMEPLIIQMLDVEPLPVVRLEISTLDVQRLIVEPLPSIEGALQ
jgi:hypothetical protein